MQQPRRATRSRLGTGVGGRAAKLAAALAFVLVVCGVSTRSWAASPGPTVVDGLGAVDSHHPEGPGPPETRIEDANADEKTRRREARRAKWAARRKVWHPPGPEIDDECGSGESGCFLQEEALRRHAGRAYLRSRYGRDPRYIRAALQIAILLGAGKIWYQVGIEENREHWDDVSFGERFTYAGVRLDDNSFPLNMLYHPLAGTAYHLLARTNDIALGWAVLYSSLASSVWEYAFEPRENVSINDLIMTTGSGIVVGEFWYKLGKYLTSAPGGGHNGHKALAWSLGAFQSVNDAISRKPRARTRHVDEHGLSADFAHAFEFSYGIAGVENIDAPDFVLHDLRIGGRIVSLPGHHREGQFVRPFWGGDFTSLDLRGGAASGGYGVTLDSDVTLAGVYGQSIAVVPKGRRGLSWMLGGAMSYRYRWERYPHWRDRIAALYLPGPRLELDGFAGPLQLHLAAKIQYGFAGVHSSLIDEWQRTNPDAIGKSTARLYSYYYAWSIGSGLELELRLPYASLGGDLVFAYFNSAEGYDRVQQDLTVDQRIEDRAFDYDLWLRIQPWSFGLVFEPSLQGRWRSEYLGSMHDIREHRRWMMSVGYVW